GIFFTVVCLRALVFRFVLPVVIRMSPHSRKMRPCFDAEDLFIILSQSSAHAQIRPDLKWLI
ncbi:MAG: hypothetical protein U1D06_09400, partial [Paracoccaceae bacterium]|nr:hypothetical protein [Paracoccaceae bacterium]